MSSGNSFVRSLLNMQSNAINNSKAPVQFATIKSGADRALAYGALSNSTKGSSYIRDADNTVYFMVGVDTVGSNAVIRK